MLLLSRSVSNSKSVRPQDKLAKWIVLLILAVQPLMSQTVFERGTFVSIPAGKHVNHIFEGTWNTYLAVEDGVLIYDQQNDKWLEPITASNGMAQYPALLVWEDSATAEVWIVTPDFLFVYDPGSGWMQEESLPGESVFTGRYTLGVTPQRVLVSASGGGDGIGYTAVFLRNSAKFERWGPDSSLAMDWAQVTRYDTNIPEPGGSGFLLTDQVNGGGFDADGRIRLEGYPQQLGAEVSAISTSNSGEAFLGTQGLGLFYRSMRGATWQHKPFGLLTPDVMSLVRNGDQLLVGGRAGLTTLVGFDPSYDEAIADPTFDYSFVSAISFNPKTIFIAGRDGIFKRPLKGVVWNRLVKKDDLQSKRIYSLAAGSGGNLMVGTDQNAYLYHESGLVLRSVFPKNSTWAVYHIAYEQGKYYLATVFGLYVFDEQLQAFTARINSQGQVQSPHTSAAMDPVYRVALSDSTLWATTSRGLVKINLISRQGEAFLSPYTPFQPRGLIFHGKRVWIGSESGLYSFDPKTLAWRQYTSRDGLVSNFITDLAAAGDYIWVGSNLGLTRVTWRNLN